jgi:hypothetical protein
LNTPRGKWRTEVDRQTKGSHLLGAISSGLQ